MINSYHLGLVVEWLTMIMLGCSGYRILKHRYKTKFGEIDVIALHQNTVIFIEVKSRKTTQDALEAVNLKTQKRIIKAAKHFIASDKKRAAVDGYRFDVVVWRSIFHFSHIKNAFIEEH